MKPPFRIFGRTPRRLLENIGMLPSNVWGMAKSIAIFRQPFRVLHHYVHRTLPSDLELRTRSGLRIHLPGDEDDVITVFLNFVRRDYGPVPPGSVVVDVGGHLGSFTLFAIWQGAARVYCLEPDPKLYEAIRTNLQANRLENKVTALNLAMTGQDGGLLRFRREGNASGHVIANMPKAGEVEGEVIEVKSVSLAVFMEAQGLDRIDLLKLDCEGSEYGIVENTPVEVWRRIKRIRLEYHLGRVDELKKKLAEAGFRVVHEHPHASGVGLIWFDRQDG